MRRTKLDLNFFISFLLNVLLNLEGAIPGVILLILHFIFHISIWWAIGAFLAWIVYLLVWMWVLSLINKCSKPAKPKENKNPYSKKSFPSHKDDIKL